MKFSGRTLPLSSNATAQISCLRWEFRTSLSDYLSSRSEHLHGGGEFRRGGSGTILFPLRSPSSSFCSFVSLTRVVVIQILWWRCSDESDVVWSWCLTVVVTLKLWMKEAKLRWSLDDDSDESSWRTNRKLCQDDASIRWRRDEDYWSVNMMMSLRELDWTWLVKLLSLCDYDDEQCDDFFSITTFLLAFLCMNFEEDGGWRMMKEDSIEGVKMRWVEYSLSFPSRFLLWVSSVYFVMKMKVLNIRFREKEVGMRWISVVQSMADRSDRSYSFCYVLSWVCYAFCFGSLLPFSVNSLLLWFLIFSFCRFSSFFWYEEDGRSRRLKVIQEKVEAWTQENDSGEWLRRIGREDSPFFSCNINWA